MPGSTSGATAAGMLLGALLMSSFVASPESALRQRGLRWGLVVIGAAAWALPAEQWLSARFDVERIPYATQSIAGLSDASRLVERYGWPEAQLISRYVFTAFATLTLTVVRWAYGLWSLSDDDRADEAG